jgi:hypothetical protein
LVADKLHEDKRAAEHATRVRERLRELEKADSGLDTASPAVKAMFENFEKERDERVKVWMEKRRKERSDVFPLVSADFEKKFAKTAGKMLTNMKKHAEYIAKLAGISGQR